MLHHHRAWHDLAPCNDYCSACGVSVCLVGALAGFQGQAGQAEESSAATGAAGHHTGHGQGVSHEAGNPDHNQSGSWSKYMVFESGVMRVSGPYVLVSQHTRVCYWMSMFVEVVLWLAMTKRLFNVF